MRVAIAMPQVPFVRGGAEFMAAELQKQLVIAGHQADIISLPFRFAPESEALAGIDAWQHQNFDRFDIGNVDRVIALKFPAYFLKHPELRIWMLHQHRTAYELADGPGADQSLQSSEVRHQIRSLDNECLAAQQKIFVISNTVGKRLHANNQVCSQTIYPPPPAEADLGPGLVYPYVFFPSRLESLKRQDFLIRAMQYIKTPVKALIAGEGGMYSEYASLIETLGLSDRVKLLGNVSRSAMINYYQNALAVCFTPFDEDYGFVTAEAMLCAKPVVTCADSGGPTELVVHGETGFVSAPDPECIAAAINELWHKRSRAIEMGRAGLAHYQSMNISWEYALNRLLEK